MSIDTTAPAVEEIDQEATEAFVGRIFEAALGSMDLLAIGIGDRLGLYAALAEDGPLTSTELARRAGVAERYTREWLEQQAGTGTLTGDPGETPHPRPHRVPPDA